MPLIYSRNEMIVVIVACYNEAGSLYSTLNELASELGRIGEEFRIVIVDDGSTDGSPEIYERFAADHAGDVEAIRFDENRGVGAVFRAGLARAAELVREPADMVAIVEADGTNDLALLGRMRDEIRRGAGLVVASRHSKGSKVRGKGYRVVLSRVVNRYLRSKFRHLADIREFSYFFKAVSADALRRAYERYGERFITSGGFAASAELTIKLLASGVRAVELPTEYLYQSGSSSKLRVWSTIGEYLTLTRRLKREL